MVVKKFNEFINEDFTDLYKRWKKKETRKEDSLEVKMKDFISTKKNPQDYYIENGLVCCKGVVIINDDDLVDGKFPFKLGKVERSFNCSSCTKLTSLEGAPQIVGDDFYCSNCTKLTSLEGAPEKVIYFDCSACEKLTSLEGSPKEVVHDFCCGGCINLTSLEGAPEYVGGDFYCHDCVNLTSLEGAPEYVGGDFYCNRCGKEFTESDLPAGTIIKRKFKNGL